MKKLITVIFLWLCWGFSLGTLLLLGPVRWIINFQREGGMAESTEKITVIILIGILAVISFAIAFYSAKSLSNPDTSGSKRAALWSIPVMSSLCAVFVFFHPDWINTEKTGTVTTVNTSFSTGPYPEIEKMYDLKSMGYTAVISLLHPAVVPFEPALLVKEKKNAAEAGLEFIHIPLLPWVSENENSIDSLRRLIKNAHGKYYIHCYLGVDRVAAATRIINQEGKAIINKDNEKKDSLILKKKFERGNVTELEKGVFIGPQLTKEEYFFVISNFQQVVALRNFSEPDSKLVSEAEEKWLQPYKIPLKTFEVNEKTSPAKMQEIVNAVRALPRPVFIHEFFTHDKEIVLFQELYKKSLK